MTAQDKILAHWISKNALLVMLCLSLGTNALLAWRIHKQSTSARVIGGEWLKPSDSVLPFSAVDSSGHAVTVSYSGTRATVLYVFTPQCGWCLKNIGNLTALQAQAANRYRLVGIALEKKGLQEYLQSHGLQFPVYTDLPPTVLKSYHFGSTPETVAVGPDGRIIKAWTGAYGSATVRDIEAHLHVSLPGPVQ